MMEIKNKIDVPVLEISQPIGKFYIGIMTARELLDISYADMRRIEGDLDRYVGIQRSLSKSRVSEISSFVKSIDATFPTSIVLAVNGECAVFDADTRILTISEGIDLETGEKIPINESASILDGQHRVEGLREAGADNFQVPVSIFVDADIADQAYIFATVNLAQTKVNKSLVYDLLDYSKSRSPQKSAHDIVVALDKFEKSPFYKLIKRLGAATPGREGETLAQATVVNGIIPLISKNPELDRYELAKKRRISPETDRYEETPLRRLWIDEKDGEIAKIFIEYFNAVKSKWPTAWNSREKGHILARTNGFRAFMRLFKNIYLKEKPVSNTTDPVIQESVFLNYFNKSTLQDQDFNSSNFAPGTSGETALYRRLREELGV
ncbi:DGQHR domain-containing protein [Castellaniella sp.]|uniref:DGQHR domain-containing protein n=1 Tax=Castellaniella sp. TaxID=1955812 RepID=UPI003A8FBDB0